MTGFDTGPGNTLMDVWVHREQAAALDQDGRWAAGGNVDEALPAALLGDPYFLAPPPKSTGREYFNPDWLLQHPDPQQLAGRPWNIPAVTGAARHAVQPGRIARPRACS